MLLLDGPSNDLDVETLRALEDALLEIAGSVLVISHDRWFLDRIVTHILAAKANRCGLSSRATIQYWIHALMRATAGILIPSLCRTGNN